MDLIYISIGMGLFVAFAVYVEFLGAPDPDHRQ